MVLTRDRNVRRLQREITDTVKLWNKADSAAEYRHVCFCSAHTSSKLTEV